ncbi:MAG: A/G-specific adenine glycosylase [Endozoicomonadaceae bacterium]|nr:A/G-specific adenine glycosylase [Endozoicomonadaceae bacterium]
MNKLEKMNDEHHAETFSSKILKWFNQHGRTHLPWQQQITPYRVWVSEIMLQQTQVSTVIPYFLKFMSAFPVLEALAGASIDDVLFYWSGLGYYSRARNLHLAAQKLQTLYPNELPKEVEQWVQLPGIGLSTAGAIVSISFDLPAIVLDGNIKRVLIRHFLLPGYPEQAALKKQLYSIAATLLPQLNGRNYSQAMMDLGAMICTKREPKCTECPIQTNCQAYIQHLQTQYPMVKPKKPIPKLSAKWLILLNKHHEILIQKVIDLKLWNQLWVFPEWPADKTMKDMRIQCQVNTLLILKKLPVFRHHFTHFSLDIEPIFAFTEDQLSKIEQNQQWDSTQWRWVSLNQPIHLGMPLPVKKLWVQLVQTDLSSIRHQAIKEAIQ